MKTELKIPSSLGFCKNCFRSRRSGSAYCGECQDDPERLVIYISDEYFPLFKDVVKKFGFNPGDMSKIVFTYGNIIYAKTDLPFHLIAHELTHVFQQIKMGKNKWWKKYLEDDEFRLKQEVEAYRQQYKISKNDSDELAYRVLEKISGDLSGELYGNLVDFKTAKSMITGLPIEDDMI